jgi:FAD/FMN-containing dehydrogenase
MPGSKVRVHRRRFLEISGAATAGLFASCKGGAGSAPSAPVDARGPSSKDGAAPAKTDGSAPAKPDGAPDDKDAQASTGTDAPAPGPKDAAKDADGAGQVDAADEVAAGPPTEADWKALASKLAGGLIRPADALYDQARVVFNTRFDSIRPQAVARCKTTDDVVAVLAFVRRFALAVTPRSGGHNFAGHSTGTGVVIDLGPMNTIQVGDGTATIGGGAKLADVYDQLIARGVGIPLGTCLSVGISGLTLGGGIGVIDRMYGLTCDSLVSAQVVTADGRLLTCDAANEPDLFWALRGGGGGNFGVVTSFTFRTHATQSLTNFSATYRFADAAKVLAAWQTWQREVPDSIWSYLIFTFFTPGAAPVLTLAGVCVGSPADFMPHWNQFLAAAQAPAATTNVAVQSYRDTMMGFCAGRTVSQCHLVGQTPDGQIQRQAFASTSDFFDAALPAEGIQALVQGIKNAQSAGIRGQILLDAMGGALGRVAPDATAFPHRRALFSAEYYMDAAGVTSPSWQNSMRTLMKPWSSGRAYVNYMDPLITDATAYYGDNYARLVTVKAKYDPRQVFRLPQGIPPA